MDELSTSVNSNTGSDETCLYSFDSGVSPSLKQVGRDLTVSELPSLPK